MQESAKEFGLDFTSKSIEMIQLPPTCHYLYVSNNKWKIQTNCK